MTVGEVGEVGYLCFYVWMRSVLTAVEIRRLIGRQLRVDSCGRSGAAVEIGLGGRGMKPFRAFEHVCQSLHVCTLYMAGGEKFLLFLPVRSVKFTRDACSRKKTGKFD